MGSVRGNETNLSLKKRKRGGVEICLLDTSMSKNKNEEVYKIGINWASHIYAKLSLNPYKIRKLKN